MTIVPEPSWEDLIESLLKYNGAALIIGATDSGKSSLVRYLTGRLISEFMRVCLVDADVGQSSLGLPGTISMKVFKTKEDLEDFVFESMSFVGTLNPAKKIALIIATTQRLAETCGRGSDITLIDTSGLISGETGKALKAGKIRAVKPQHIIAVQRKDELEHILKYIEHPRIHRVSASRFARARSVAARINYRKKKFDDYFDASRMSDFLLHTNETKFYYNDKPLTPKEGLLHRGVIIGLNHGEDTVALGILDDITDKYVTFASPIRSLKKINKVVFGDVAV